MALRDEDANMNAGLEAASADTLLDSAALNEIRSLDPDGSAGFFAKIVDTFIRNTEQLFQNTNWADPAMDPDSIRKAAHYLKSSAGSIGARRLSALCGSLETGIRMGETTDVERRYAKIRSVYLETREALQSALAGGES